MADYAPFVLAMSVVLFAHMLPTFAAVVVPVWAGWRVLGPHKWVCRRALGGWIVFGAVGYVALFVYYAIVGTPPQASSIFNHSLHGAFFGAGYGGIAALLYFRTHKNNPARRNSSIEINHVA
jgi:hypothetical protein